MGMEQRNILASILGGEYNYRASLPKGHLVPAIPGRMDYVDWVLSLRALQHFKCIDVGTGPIAVYPLLLAARAKSLAIHATEICPGSFENAVETVASNGLDGQVRLVKINDAQDILATVLRQGRFDFCLCNPPFFDRLKARSCEMTASEGTFPGGELAFAKLLIEQSKSDSLDFGTCLLGHKQSLVQLSRHLWAVGARCVTSTVLSRGATRRWAVAWTFKRNVKLAKAASRRTITVRAFAKEAILAIFDGLGIAYRATDRQRYSAVAAKLTWSRQGRRSETPLDVSFSFAIRPWGTNEHRLFIDPLDEADRGILEALANHLATRLS